jgi:hypothetical protein
MDKTFKQFFVILTKSTLFIPTTKHVRIENNC